MESQSPLPTALSPFLSLVSTIFTLWSCWLRAGPHPGTHPCPHQHCCPFTAFAKVFPPQASELLFLCLECSSGYPVGSLSLPSSPGQLLKEVFPVHPLIWPCSQPTSPACAWNVLDAQKYVSKCTHVCVFIEELSNRKSFIFI